MSTSHSRHIVGHHNDRLAALAGAREFRRNYINLDKTLSMKIQTKSYQLRNYINLDKALSMKIQTKSYQLIIDPLVHHRTTQYGSLKGARPKLHSPRGQLALISRYLMFTHRLLVCMHKKQPLHLAASDILKNAYVQSTSMKDIPSAETKGMFINISHDICETPPKRYVL